MLTPNRVRTAGVWETRRLPHELPSLRLAQTSRLVRRLAKLLLLLLALAVLVIAFAPWQQSVTGSGNVVAYAPLDRQQVVESPIKGRIISWGDDIRENAYVKKGQKILEIQDVDPSLLQRLEDQLAASERQVKAQHEQFEASQRQVDAALTIVTAYEAQVEAFITVREQTVAAADEYIKMTEQKVTAAEQDFAAEEAARIQAEADYERQSDLFKEGLASEAKMQLAEQKWKEAKAKVNKAAAYVESARNELQAKRNERSAKEREAQAKIDSAHAVLRKAHSDVAKAEGDAAKAVSEITKSEKELLDMQVKLSRQQSQIVVAPRDGFILQMLAQQGGELVKEGDPLCVLVPDTADRAVQIWINGNDAPLVEVGRHVRLQFEGWPAVQFAGWPSVAVGTFGGQVAAVDSTDDGKGKFRVLIRPDPNDPPWPADRFLRQGVRANGWILLNRVSLSYEVWRRLNGFPPVISTGEPKSDSKGSGAKDLIKAGK